MYLLIDFYKNIKFEHAKYDISGNLKIIFHCLSSFKMYFGFFYNFFKFFNYQLLTYLLTIFFGHDKLRHQYRYVIICIRF